MIFGRLDLCTSQTRIHPLSHPYPSPLPHRKRSKPGEEEAMGWDSPWGHGRPGWHIECSAMTHHLLRDRLEIHSGGIDLCFPHHTNEIAQCEAFGFRTEEKGGTVDEDEIFGGGRCSTSPAAAPTAAGEEWVKVWLHTGHLYIQGLKMSKSLKNFITVQECLKRHHADDFRVFCLQRRYGANVDYRCVGGHKSWGKGDRESIGPYHPKSHTPLPLSPSPRITQRKCHARSSEPPPAVLQLRLPRPFHTTRCRWASNRYKQQQQQQQQQQHNKEQ